MAFAEQSAIVIGVPQVGPRQYFEPLLIQFSLPFVPYFMSIHSSANFAM